MTRTKRTQKPRRRRSYKAKEGLSPTSLEERDSYEDIARTSIIPDFHPQRVTRYLFRYENNTSNINKSIAWTTQMMLDEFAVSMGSGTARRIFNAIKLHAVEIWSTAAAIGNAGIEFEWSPALVAGSAGSFRVPTICSKLQSPNQNKNQHLRVRPNADELSSKVFTAQQASYVLFNAAIPATSCIQFEFDAMFWNGEGSPYATSYSSSSAAGTIGCGNFSGSGMTGWRVQGWSNLSTP